jgi:hypothetical protein
LIYLIRPDILPADVVFMVMLPPLPVILPELVVFAAACAVTDVVAKKSTIISIPRANTRAETTNNLFTKEVN